MADVCFYFQVHQPYRLRQYNIFNIGKDKNYFDEKKNKEIMHKVAKKCYIPTNKLMLNLIHKHGEKFKISYSLSGTAIDQFEQYSPEVLDLFVELAQTGNVEFLNETYYHSLSYLHSKEEFKEQVMKHGKKIKELFGQKPQVFRNTELIFNNELAKFVEEMGFKAILAEGADHILGWKSPNYVYKAKTTQNLRLLLKNYKLSDDIAFRFSNKGWKEHPLTTGKFTSWLAENQGHSTNLFMDYETFGEHQWEDTGIFKFLGHLPEEAIKRNILFKTPSEVAKEEPVDEVDIHNFISWADVERDLSAWLGNPMQDTAIHEIYKLEQAIKKSNNPELIESWRKLQTSDHFYYMCTKWFNDGDVHKYFNPYDSPYECYINYMNVLNDMIGRLNTTQVHPKAIPIHNNPSMRLG